MAVPRDFDHSCLAAGPAGCSSSDAQRLYQVTDPNPNPSRNPNPDPNPNPNLSPNANADPNQVTERLMRAVPPSSF